MRVGSLLKGHKVKMGIALPWYSKEKKEPCFLPENQSKINPWRHLRITFTGSRSLTLVH